MKERDERSSIQDCYLFQYSSFSIMASKFNKEVKAEILLLIEKKGLDRKTVDLATLDELDFGKFGYRSNPGVTKFRSDISTFLSGVKRKLAHNYYLQDLKPCKVTPSHKTTQQIRSEKGNYWKPIPNEEESDEEDFVSVVNTVN